MRPAASWMALRSPRPPGPLARWMAGSVGNDPVLHRALLEPALSALDRARANPGRVRKSAFELLGADALLTHACEAALESDDPISAFGEILRAVAADRR